MKIPRRRNRFIIWLFWTLLNSVGIFCMIFMLKLREPWWRVLLSMIFPIFGTLMAVLFLYEAPKLLLQQDGVYVKHWFRTRFYPWEEFCQTGVSCFYTRGYFVNRLVLVRRGCSQRGYRDPMFHLRNLGKLIYIPYTPQTREFVLSCYGPLDFNLANGNDEKSIVIDQ